MVGGQTRTLNGQVMYAAFNGATSQHLQMERGAWAKPKNSARSAIEILVDANGQFSTRLPFEPMKSPHPVTASPRRHRLDPRCLRD